MRTLLYLFTTGTCTDAGTTFKTAKLKAIECQLATGAYNHLTVHFRLATVLKIQSSYLQSVTLRLKFQEKHS